ncbi:MAG: DUF3987 domain-containing protein [Isosphaeraceae bacterium]
MIQAKTCLDTALELLHCFKLWPVPIKPGEKAPIGESWGSTRPTEQSIKATFTRFPKAGLGLLLGPEAGIIDIECDGPEGEESLAKLMGGEIVLTLGWSSVRGPHHVFRYDARLARYGKSIIKLSELPGLEIRIGGNGKQLQSKCPPTIGTDSKPREWNGNDIVADLPEAVFLFLDAALSQPRREPRIVPPDLTLTVTSAQDAYATKALDDECQAVALAPDGEQNETLNAAAFNLGQLVGAGVLNRSEVERRLLDAAAGYVCKDGEHAARATIQSGLKAGQNQPRDLSHLNATGNGRHEPGKNGVPSGPPLWPPLRFSEPPRALPFPVDVFPLAIQRFCRELAEATLAPVDFVGVSTLATAGAAIGQSINIRTKRGWNEPPLLNVIIVAPPGKTKSPVIRAVVKPLSEIDRRLREDSARERAAWEDRKKAHAKDDSKPPPGPEPPQLRAIVKDITRESLVIILADNPRGVLCDPDEASAWVASFNEYKGKGGSDRQFWLSIWGSAAVSVDRKGGRESTYVAFPFVSVLGGLPPDMLTSLRDERGRNDGFLDRIMFSYPDEFPPQRWTERELSPEAESDWSDVIGRLFAIRMRVDGEKTLPHLVSFTSEAKTIWVDWFNRHADEMEGPEFSERQAGAWSKLRAHAARFALILSRLRLACDPCSPEASNTLPPVAAGDVRGAVKLVDYFKSHLARIGHQMTAGIGSAEAKALADWIKRHRLSMFRESEVREHLRRFRDKPADLAAAINALKALGAIRPRPEPPEPGKRGPKLSPAYDVHPDLLGAPGNSADSANSPSEPPLEAIKGIGGIIGRVQASGSAPPPDREVFEL